VAPRRRRVFSEPLDRHSDGEGSSQAVDLRDGLRGGQQPRPRRVTGQVEDAGHPEQGKDPAAVALGWEGGKARSLRLTGKIGKKLPEGPLRRDGRLARVCRWFGRNIQYNKGCGGRDFSLVVDHFCDDWAGT
jgi:hypothetical protein